ncbi:MAG: DUF2339 domain-containing protein [Acidobacteriota bacterium]
MISLFAFLAAIAAIGLFVWLRGKVERLEEEVRRLSAPEHAVTPFASPVSALQPETVDFSSKVNTEPEQAAPPVAFPVPPVAFAPPPITPSKQSAVEGAPPLLAGAAASVGEGAEKSPVDWEGFVGVKLFSWTAGIFLTLGAIFFLRYSIERGWLSPPIQMAIGLLAGLSILVVCELKAAQRYAVTATALAAAGLAILFATFYAAHARWDLLGLLPAFVALALVAALAVALSVRHDSAFIAGLGLLGGFATPALLGTAEDRPGALLSYLLLLDGGLAWAAAKRRWIFLPVASLALTSLFALSLATSPDDGSLWPILFGFLLLLDAGLLVFAAVRDAPALHVMAGLATLVVLGAWFVRSATPDLLGPGLAAAGAFGVFYFVAPALAAGVRSPGAIPDGAAHLGLLGSFLILFVASQHGLSSPPDPRAAVALGVLVGAGAWVAARRGPTGLQVASLALASFVPLVLAVVATNAPGPVRTLGAAAALALFGVAAWVWKEDRAFALGAAVALFLAQAVAISVSFAHGAPPFRAIFAAHVVFLVALLALAAGAGAQGLAVLAVLPAAGAAYAWELAHRRGSGLWKDELLLGGAFWVIFLAYPLVLGKRAARVKEPYLAAVLASAVFFPLFRTALADGGYRGVMGLLPLVLALGLAVLLARLLTLGVPPEEDRARLALVAGAILAFVTVAIPLQFEREWLTLGWALLGAALAWLFGRIPHRGLVLWSGGLFAAAFLRLAMNPAVLTYHPRSSAPFFNWYLAVYGVAAATFFLGARLLRPADDERARRLADLLPAGGVALLFVLVNLEIANFFAEGAVPAFNVLSSSLAEGLAYTLSWAGFAIVLLVVSIATGNRRGRIAAVVLLVVTILKCFLFDLARLGGLYRVASFVGLAICLAAVAVLLQRFVLPRRDSRT